MASFYIWHGTTFACFSKLPLSDAMSVFSVALNYLLLLATCGIFRDEKIEEHLCMGDQTYGIKHT